MEIGRRIEARAAVEVIRAGTALQNVVTPTAIERVCSALAVEVIIACAASKHVIGCAADQRVAAVLFAAVSGRKSRRDIEIGRQSDFIVARARIARN